MNKILITLLSITLIGLIVYDSFFRKISVPDPIIEISYQHQTDTIWKDTLFIPGKPYLIPTPPKTVILYQTDSSALDSLSIILKGKDIIISDLKDSIAIHQNYLKQFPSNPKLLAVNLKRDTMAISLLQISGQIQRQDWPIDLNRFAYRWDYTINLSRKEVSEPPTLEKPFAKYFVGGGVDLLYKSPYISGRIEKDWASIRFYSTIDVGLLEDKTSSIKFGVEYKLNGKSHY